MKLRNWVLIASMLLVALASAFYEARLYFEKKRRIEDLVVQAVSPYINGSFQVGTISLGFFSVHLRDVQLLLPARAIAVGVGDIKVNFSIVKLLRSGFDLPRSISTIMLIGPTLEFSLAPSSAAVFPGPAKPRVAVRQTPTQASRSLALEYLSVKKGVIRLREKDGSVTVLGEELKGRLWSTRDAMEYRLNGRLGAARKNLFVSGRISWRGEKHRLSIKVNSAELKRPLTFTEFAVRGGALTGALEVSFPDSIARIADVEANGWIRLAHGTCFAGRMKKPFDSVNAQLSIANTRLTVDSLSLRYANARFRVKGTWDVAGASLLDRIDFDCRNLSLDSLGVGPSAIQSMPRIGGSGWVRARLLRSRGSDMELTASGGGITIGGIPLIGLFGRVKFQNRQLSIDSLTLKSPGCSVTGAGIVDYSKTPLAYSFRCNGSLDSLSRLARDGEGALHISGTISAMGAERRGSLSVRGKELRWRGLAFYSVGLTAQIKGDSAVFKVNNDDRACRIKAAGSVRHLFKNHTETACTLAVLLLRASPLIPRLPAALPRPDSVKASAIFTGCSDSFQVKAAAEVYSPDVKGGFLVRFDKRRAVKAPIAWGLESRTLALRGTTLPCQGAGKLYNDSLRIDSLVFPGRVAASGKIALGGKPRIDAVCRYDFRLKDMLALAGKGAGGIDGGTIAGNARISGPFDNMASRAEARVRDVVLGGVGKFQTDAIVAAAGGSFTVLPLVLRKDERVVASIDTITNTPHLRFSGRFDDLDIRALFGGILPEEAAVEGQISGSFHSSEKGLPLTIGVSSQHVRVNGWGFDSVRLAGALDSLGIRIRSLRACDGARTVITGNGFVPLSILQGEESEKDTLEAAIKATGDLIATVHANISDVIDGSGQGSMTLSLYGQPENWHVREGSLVIPKGKLLLRPYVPGEIANFSCSMTLSDSSFVTTAVSGQVGKRRVRIFSTHALQPGYEPIVVGPVDFGILQIETPQHGLDIHLPGFMEEGETGDLEPTGKPPFRYFSLAGPASGMTIVGTLYLRDLEFTYPLLKFDGTQGGHGRINRDRTAAASSAETDADSLPTANRDILSLVKWDMDLRAADRKVVYFRDISGYNARLMRFLEANIDEGSSVLRLRGAIARKTFRLTGILRSYHGAVYYGKSFDRNFEATLEFIPQKKESGTGIDNSPILSGSVEAMADTARFERIKLVALVQDPRSGALSERGRLTSGRLNVIFHLSSDFEELPGESEREFYRQAGLQFTTIGNAGKFMSDFGEQYLHRYFLQRVERRLAKSIGLDVINVETSIASNYFNRFYNRQFDNVVTQADYLALANVGVTVGRYFFRDNLFIKARGGLIPVDTALTPEYSFGLEFQPTRYLFMDFDYGFYKGEAMIEHNPRVNLQLRLPISRLRNLFDF